MNKNSMYEVNTHWRSKVYIDRVYRHGLAGDLSKEILWGKDRIFYIYGSYGVGKTFLLKSIINNIINSGVDTYKVFYLSLDDDIDIINSLKRYENEVLGNRLENINDRVYIFLDDVELNNAWPVIVEEYVKGNENIKVIAASSIYFKPKIDAKEIYLKPLSFREYLELKGYSIPDIELEYYTLRYKYIEYLNLSNIFNKYFLTAGLPGLLNLDRIPEIRSRFRDEILNRILLLVSKSIRRREPILIERMLKIISMNPGTYINYNELSDMLSKDIRTVINYFDILQNSFLAYIVKNKTNGGRGSRKMPKAYPYLHLYTLLYYPEKFKVQEDYSKILEGFLALHLNANYYWRRGGKETSFIWRYRDEDIPVVVKYVKKLTRREIKKVETLFKKMGVDRGIIVAKDTFDLVGDGKEIYIMPPWLLLLIDK